MFFPPMDAMVAIPERGSVTDSKSTSSRLGMNNTFNKQAINKQPVNINVSWLFS
jgi:hypothetical protein|tara:strand:- start:177 stop:338 length:162 start_codon:yes stop_codon:yes gene_type:complete